LLQLLSNLIIRSRK